MLAQTRYYENLRQGLGSRFRGEVEAAALRAAEFPLHGKASAGGTRRRLVNDFPFAVIYTEIAGGVLVHAIADERRPPAYWLARLPE